MLQPSQIPNKGMSLSRCPWRDRLWFPVSETCADVGLRTVDRQTLSSCLDGLRTQRCGSSCQSVPNGYCNTRVTTRVTAGPEVATTSPSPCGVTLSIVQDEYKSNLAKHVEMIFYDNIGLSCVFSRAGSLNLCPSMADIPCDSSMPTPSSRYPLNFMQLMMNPGRIREF